MRRIFNILVFICLGTLCSSTLWAQEMRVRVVTDYRDVCKFSLTPLGNIPMYIHASALLENGKGDVSFELPAPMVVELKCQNSDGRPMRRTLLYLEPGKDLTVYIRQGQPVYRPVITFEGMLAAENKTLDDLSLLFNMINTQNSDLVQKEEQIREQLSGMTFDSQFAEHILHVVHIQVLSQQLQSSSKMGRKALTALLQEVKKGDCWQSIFEWPELIARIFAKSRETGLLKEADDLSWQLDYIRNAVIKQRYGLFQLNYLVNSRGWFEKSPEAILKKLKPYMTTPSTIAEWENIYDNYQRIADSWQHLHVATAPDFTFESTDGRMITLSDYRGKFVLLDVWNIYCGPCKKQVPILRDIEPQLKEMGVEVIGVSCDPQDIKDKWKKSVKDQNMKGIQTIMDNGRQSAFMKDYCIVGFPTFILINPDGMVVNPNMYYPQSSHFIPYVKEKIQEYQTKKKL